MTALATAGITDRRFAGAGRVIGLGRACAYVEGSKTIDEQDARSADAGRAYSAGTGAGAWSDEPMRRPDHKAKKHSRPVPKNKRRWAREVKDAVGMLAVGLMAGAATLVLGWPLRHDGEMIWVALTAV